MKAKYVTGVDGRATEPTNDEWSDIYDAIVALLAKLDHFTWADRHVALKEYLAVHDALEARGTKPQSKRL